MTENDGSLDNVYEAPTEELYAHPTPAMVPAKTFRVTKITWEKKPTKKVVVQYSRTSGDGETTVSETATFSGAAFQAYRKREPLEGENLGDQEENAACEALVAKGKIPPDAVIV